ncbi:MAG: SDR family NAD(P)-dependent oxidoreductase [Hyphomicrobiales bacterium]
MTKRLYGKIALVTGASRGLGFATAVHLAREGAHIIATARTQGGLEELDDAVQAVGGSATLVPHDLRDFDGIDRLGAAIYERWKRLDILIGNAGVLGKLAPLPHTDPKVWNEVMEISVTANYRLIRSMDPLLRLSDAGRAVFLTSGYALKCTPYWGAYCVSRAALEAMMKVYAAEMANSKVRVNCFSPGPVRTDLRATAMPGEDPETLPTPAQVMAQIVPLCLSEFTDSGAVYRYSPTGVYKQYGAEDLLPKS